MINDSNDSLSPINSAGMLKEINISETQSDIERRQLISRIENNLYVDKDSDKNYNTGNYKTGRDNDYFKDAVELRHIFAYSFGHLANDLVITIWNTYATWYLN